MRVVFFGTPQFAVPSLHAMIARGLEVAGVVTQPDKARGRSRNKLVPPAVKTAALELGLEVFQPDRPAGDLFRAQLRRLAADIGVVAAYGHILRPEILDTPPLGMINVHASLLPRWRGAAPIQHAILEGDRVSGVSIMRMEEGLDSGPVTLQRELPLESGETAGELTERLSELGAEALIEALDAIEAGTARWEPQDESLVTMAPKITRDSARLDWASDAERVARQTLAFDPSPGAWCLLDGQVLKLFRGRVTQAAAEPGTVIGGETELVVACGSGAVALSEVQPAGRKRMTAADWLRGMRGLPGRTLD